MCGIVGIASVSGAAVKSSDKAVAMRETLAHRGPDGAGVAESSWASLQIRRLAIVDLQRGDQPFTSPDGLVSLVCNGEIYNADALRRESAAQDYPFRSRSDVETILPLYLSHGVQAIARLEGMFGLVIADGRTHTLVLARDRSGEKPLFYAEAGGELLVASEPKALLAHPAVSRELDPVAVALYVALGYVPQPFTLHRAIKKLPPGHVLAAGRDGLAPSAYWDPVRFARDKRPVSSARELAAELRAALRRAVARELMADVPVGIFISGGLDSSLLVALAAEHFQPGALHTYTIAFGDRSYDESEPAALVAGHFGTTHRAVPADPERLREALDFVTSRLDEPLGDPAVLPTYLLSIAASRDVKVILSGEGADELFGGYPTYLGHRVSARYAGLPGWVRGAIRRAVNAWPASSGKVTLEFLLKRFVVAAELPAMERHLEWFGALGPAALGRVLGPAAMTGAREAHDVLAERVALVHEAGDVLEQALLLDFLTYLPDDLLTKVDRATMLASIEARAPFLDREVIELALRTPARLKVRGLSSKLILKRAARPLLPPSVLRRRKRGLSVPVASWINGALRDEVDRLLGRERLASEGWLNPDAVDGLLAEHRSGRVNHARRLWPLVMLERWLETWGAS